MTAPPKPIAYRDHIWGKRSEFRHIALGDWLHIVSLSFVDGFRPWETQLAIDWIRGRPRSLVQGIGRLNHSRDLRPRGRPQRPNPVQAASDAVHRPVQARIHVRAPAFNRCHHRPNAPCSHRPVHPMCNSDHWRLALTAQNPTLVPGTHRVLKLTPGYSQRESRRMVSKPFAHLANK